MRIFDLRQWRGGSNRHYRPVLSHRPRPSLEGLEDRSLLSATPLLPVDLDPAGLALSEEKCPVYTEEDGSLHLSVLEPEAVTLCDFDPMVYEDYGDFDWQAFAPDITEFMAFQEQTFGHMLLCGLLPPDQLVDPDSTEFGEFSTEDWEDGVIRFRPFDLSEDGEKYLNEEWLTEDYYSTFPMLQSFLCGVLPTDAKDWSWSEDALVDSDGEVYWNDIGDWENQLFYTCVDDQPTDEIPLEWLIRGQMLDSIAYTFDQSEPFCGPVSAIQADGDEEIAWMGTALTETDDEVLPTTIQPAEQTITPVHFRAVQTIAQPSGTVSIDTDTLTAAVSSIQEEKQATPVVLEGIAMEASLSLESPNSSTMVTPTDLGNGVDGGVVIEEVASEEEVQLFTLESPF